MRHDGMARTGNGGASGARRAVRSVVVMGLALAGVTGCARTSVENVNVQAAGLPRPQVIVVHDFGVSPGDVSLDSAIGARITEMAKGTPEADEQLKVGREVAKVVTENLVKEIRKLGIPAEPAAAATPVAGPSLSIEGHFVSVDQGNRLRRMVVGFGAGASEVRTLVQVYETTNEGRRLVGEFDKRTAGLPWERAQTLGRSPYEIVAIASMIEREAQDPKEASLVSAVIHNRLRANMALGIDATIRYGIDKPTGALLQSELDRDTPYNTRLHAGIPPTPIANPGATAIKAALEPADSDALYFVRVTDCRHHFFTKSFQEFQAKAAEQPASC